MELRYTFDQTAVTAVAGHNRIEAAGWIIRQDGTVPHVVLMVNGKRAAAQVSYQKRDDVIAALKQDTAFGLNTETADHNCGFILLADEIPGELKEIRIGTEENEVLKQMDEKEIGETAVRHLIQGKIDTLTYNPDSQLYSLFGWAYSRDGLPVQYGIEDERGNALTFHSKSEKRLDVVKAVHGVNDVNCGYHIWFNGKAHLKFRLVMRTKKDQLVMPCHISAFHDFTDAMHNRMHAVHTFFHDEKGREVIKEKGLDYGLRRISYLYDEGRYYDKWMKEQQADEKELQRERDETFPYMPKISLVVPVFNTPIPYLDLMLDTVVSQSYENWELCIADGSDENHPASAEVRKYAEKDKRIRVMRLDRNYGISGNTNKAMELVSGEYTALYDHDDFLERNALYEVVKKINEENSDIIYTDEDKYLTDKKAYFMPAFKPDFSIDLLRSDNYICHFLVIRTELLHQVGGFRSEYDGSQDYDLILRCVEKAEHISHIPKILYHWRMYENSTSFDPASKLYAFEAGQRAIEVHLERVHINARVSMLEPPYYGYYRVDYVPEEEALVSIIIPNKDQKDVLDRCVQSLLKVNTYHNIEIIIAENNSTAAEINDYYAKIQAEYDNVHVIDCSMDYFNYAAINNKAVKYAHGKYLLFLNNDTEIMDPESIRSMLGIAEREDVGIVGARLLYENNTVQHAGVILSHKLNAVHAFAGLDDRDSGYMVRLHVNTNYSAVTGACMMMRMDLFEKVNGFDEKLAVAYNDVDLCLKVRKENKLVVYDAFASWHHYESLSRGYDVSEEKKARLKEEGTYLQNKWKDVYAGTDPYYNLNFDDERPFELKLK